MSCITFAFHEIKAVLQNPLFNQFFAFFEQLLPCQVAILQHLRDVAKAL